jgi:hypothetical protein
MPQALDDAQDMRFSGGAEQHFQQHLAFDLELAGLFRVGGPRFTQNRDWRLRPLFGNWAEWFRRRNSLRTLEATSANLSGFRGRNGGHGIAKTTW